MENRETKGKRTNEELTFWEHLDALRGSLIRMLAAAMAASIVAFCLKEQLFAAVLAPAHGDFPTYRWLGLKPFHLQLINTGLAEQFLVHVKMSLAVGVLVASPYMLYVLYSFVSPALYEDERRVSTSFTMASYATFLIGVLLNYAVFFPLTVRFLGSYQVSADINNMLSINSYIDTLLMMSLAFGLIFEMPVVSWLLARFGMLRPEWMRRYRRHAMVAILVIAAIITPTSDALTLLIVSLPVYLLYEVSIAIVGVANRHKPSAQV